MTLEEAGAKLRKAIPDLDKLPLNNEQLAQIVCKRYPKLYDHVSPIARRINDVIERPIESHRWTEKGRLESHGMQITNQRSEIMMLHEAEMVIKASSMGVPVAALAQIAIVEHQYEIEKKKDNDALDVGNRERLTDHELIDNLEAKLMILIDRRDKETHELKKKALTLRINRLMEELDGRAETASVQASNREGVEREEENPDSEGSSRTEVQKDMEQVSPETNRIGF